MELSARKGISIGKSLIISYLKVSIQSGGNVGFSSDYDKPQKTLVGGLKMGCVTSILILAHYFNPLI